LTSIIFHFLTLIQTLTRHTHTLTRIPKGGATSRRSVSVLSRQYQRLQTTCIRSCQNRRSFPHVHWMQWCEVRTPPQQPCRVFTSQPGCLLESLMFFPLTLPWYFNFAILQVDHKSTPFWSDSCDLAEKGITCRGKQLELATRMKKMLKKVVLMHNSFQCFKFLPSYKLKTKFC